VPTRPTGGAKPGEPLQKKVAVDIFSDPYIQNPLKEAQSAFNLYIYIYRTGTARRCYLTANTEVFLYCSLEIGSTFI
jgi:hypothetical protein